MYVSEMKQLAFFQVSLCRSMSWTTCRASWPDRLQPGNFGLENHWVMWRGLAPLLASPCFSMWYFVYLNVVKKLAASQASRSRSLCWNKCVSLGVVFLLHWSLEKFDCALNPAGHYTGSFYRGNRDGKTWRFTWKSLMSYFWWKSETRLPGQQLQKTWPRISYMEVIQKICQQHIHHGNVKTETKNPYVEVTWRSKH